MVRVAGFKPVGAEKRSGSIPPSGRRFCPRPGDRTSYALLQAFNTYFRNVDGYRRILEKVLQVSAIEVPATATVTWVRMTRVLTFTQLTPGGTAAASPAPLCWTQQRLYSLQDYGPHHHVD